MWPPFHRAHSFVARENRHLGMAEEPEEMLVEGGISTPSGIKEG
jgi:hypothetical protein